MFTAAAPRALPSAPMKPGLSQLRSRSPLVALGFERDPLDRDDARLVAGEQVGVDFLRVRLSS